MKVLDQYAFIYKMHVIIMEWAWFTDFGLTWFASMIFILLTYSRMKIEANIF